MSERKRLAGILDFAAGLLVSHEKARLQLGDARCVIVECHGRPVI